MVAKDRTEPHGEAESPVSRWSRLKSEARADLPERAEAVPEEPAAEAAAPEPAPIEDLPDVETLGYDSDFTGFLRDGVPEELQRLALRKLWRSNPVFANLDGLNDYDLDYKTLGDDARVTAALLAQREVKERLLRGQDAEKTDAEKTDAEKTEAEKTEAEEVEAGEIGAAWAEGRTEDEAAEAREAAIGSEGGTLEDVSPAGEAQGEREETA